VDQVVPAAPALKLANDDRQPRMFVVEEAGWADVALRPGRLLSFQEFRDLFSQEYLAADVQLAVGEQTILFTDMVGSTAMYAQRGDPAAFVEVKKHFEAVFALIAAHHGAVVKTIGDAAMAAFTNPVDAVRAAQAIHQAFPPQTPPAVTRLRISINTGPCIAVRLNTELDYFGHTVNIAAKLQGLADAWQVAMTEATYQAPGVSAWLEEQKPKLESLTYESKAIDAPVGVRRWTLF
jgi:class 3 adenylate cyclase